MKKGDTICVEWLDDITKRNEFAIALVYAPKDFNGTVYVLLKSHSNTQVDYPKWQRVSASARINPTFTPTRFVLIEKHIKNI